MIICGNICARQNCAFYCAYLRACKYIRELLHKYRSIDMRPNIVLSGEQMEMTILDILAVGI